MSFHILGASLTLKALSSDGLVYKAIRNRLAQSIWNDTVMKKRFKDWSQSRFVCAYSKTCVNGHSQKDRKFVLQDQLSLDAGQKYCRMLQGDHSAILSTFINSTADDWPKVLSLRTLLVRSVQHLVTYTKMFVCMSSFRIRLMTLSLMSTNGVTALEPYIPFMKDY